eukprot:TRINITY_DN29379_c0_g1_i1.p1 TRINITY_DN29379_c0_g1~~TRINITY_DN29379_c0_g1_i1.p1  ORF type:complete len:454 (+),score=122.84 TRINITY_DN29379_c0_g1_i1:59-1363(+)
MRRAAAAAARRGGRRWSATASLDFLDPPQEPRGARPAAEALRWQAEAVAQLHPSAVAQAEPVMGAVQRGLQAGASPRESLRQLTAAFAAATAALDTAVLEGMVAALLWVSAAAHGTWSQQFRRSSHNLYMCLMQRRWGGSLDRAGELARHDKLPDHAAACGSLGVDAAAAGWAETPAPRDRTARRAELRARFVEAGGSPAAAAGWPVEDIFLLLDPSDEKRFTFLHWFSELNGFCQVLTDRAVRSLAGLLAELAGPSGGIVEVGAGSGRLAHFVNAEPSIAGRMQATDAHAGDGHMESYGADAGLQPPLRLGHAEAVRRLDPAVVVSQWMPEGQDWTAEWRKAPSVRHYVLLGEADGGQCGAAWATWGRRASEFAQPPPAWLGGAEPAAGVPAPYAADGWSRRCCAETSRWMIGMGDTQGGGPTTQAVVLSRPP